MKSDPSNDPRPGRWLGVCAGGFFAAAAGYLANALVMAVIREGEWVAAMMLAVLAVACVLLGIWVLAETRWSLKGAVVAAGGLGALHLIGLAVLFFDPPASTSLLDRSLQWQLGTGFFFVWLTVLAAALRLVRNSARFP